MNTLQLTDGAEMRFMSSNCLFDATAEARSPLLFDNYLYYAPDILGLQEVNAVLYTSLIARLTEVGYTIVKAKPDYNARTDEEKASISPKYPPVNFFPILYRTDRFTEVASGFMMYKSTFTYTKGLTWAVLSRISDGKLVAHINTHCALVLKHYGLDRPDSDLGNVWRCDNVRQIYDVKAKIEAEYSTIPVFLTGDFNCREDASPYHAVIAGGMVNSKYVAEVSATHNRYTFHPVGTEPISGEDTLPIDNCFVTPENVRVLRHSIETRREVIDASDHCMVFADVAFR